MIEFIIAFGGIFLTLAVLLIYERIAQQYCKHKLEQDFEDILNIPMMRFGYWENRSPWVRCLICGSMYHETCFDTNPMNYCPNCGARMGGNDER